MANPSREVSCSPSMEICHELPPASPDSGVEDHIALTDMHPAESYTFLLPPASPDLVRELSTIGIDQAATLPENSQQNDTDLATTSGTNTVPLATVEVQQDNETATANVDELQIVTAAAGPSSGRRYPPLNPATTDNSNKTPEEIRNAIMEYNDYLFDKLQESSYQIEMEHKLILKLRGTRNSNSSDHTASENSDNEVPNTVENMQSSSGETVESHNPSAVVDSATQDTQGNNHEQNVDNLNNNPTNENNQNQQPTPSTSGTQSTQQIPINQPSTSHSQNVMRRLTISKTIIHEISPQYNVPLYGQYTRRSVLSREDLAETLNSRNEREYSPEVAPSEPRAIMEYRWNLARKRSAETTQASKPETSTKISRPSTSKGDRQTGPSIAKSKCTTGNSKPSTSNEERQTGPSAGATKCTRNTFSAKPPASTSTPVTPKGRVPPAFRPGSADDILRVAAKAAINATFNKPRRQDEDTRERAVYIRRRSLRCRAELLRDSGDSAPNSPSASSCADSESSSD